MAPAGTTRPVFIGIPRTGRLTGITDQPMDITPDIILWVLIMVIAQDITIDGLTGAVGVMEAGVVTAMVFPFAPP